MRLLKEIAKFASGAEALHAYHHAQLWYSGEASTMFGFSLSPQQNIWAALINAVISLILGLYAWGTFWRRAT